MLLSPDCVPFCQNIRANLKCKRTPLPRLRGNKHENREALQKNTQSEMAAAAPRHHWIILTFKNAGKKGSFVQWCLDKNSPGQAWERDSCHPPLVISLRSIPSLSSRPPLCWLQPSETEVLALRLLFGLFATCIFGLIWVTVYFKHFPPPPYLCPLLFCPHNSSSWSSLPGETEGNPPNVSLLCSHASSVLSCRATLLIRAAPSIL